PPALLPHLAKAAVRSTRAAHPPLGRDFDLQTWSKPSTSANPTLQRLLELAKADLRAGRQHAACLVLRLMLERAPDEPGAQALLPFVAGAGQRHTKRGPHELAALGDAHRLLGEPAEAESYYRAAL